MAREQGRARTFTRRSLLLLGGQLGLFGLLAGRLYWLQVVESEKYQTLSDTNRISLRLVPPVRGRILDREGEPLAVNRPNYRIVVVPELTGNVGATLDALANLLPVGDADRRRIMRDVARKRRFLPIVVKENLSWEDVGRVAVNTQDLPGVQFDVGFAREYPRGMDFAHVVGYVAPPAEADLTGDPLLELPTSGSAATASSASTTSPCAGAAAPASWRSTPSAGRSASSTGSRAIPARTWR